MNTTTRFLSALLTVLCFIGCNDEAVDPAAGDSGGGAGAPDSASPSCAPLPGRKCSPSGDNTLCCGLSGNVFLWTDTAACRRLLHASSSDTPYACFDTHTPAVPDNACTAGSTTTCYERYRTDEEREVVISPVQWFDPSLLEPEWHECPPGTMEKVTAANDCDP